jgi:hypothetical protein
VIVDDEKLTDEEILASLSESMDAEQPTSTQTLNTEEK